MAANEAALYARLELRIKEFEKANDRAIAKMEKTMGGIERRSAQASKAVERNMQSSAVAIEAALGRIGAAATAALASMGGAQRIVEFAENWTKARNALVSANIPLAEQGPVLERLFQQAQQYNIALNAQVNLFGSIGRAAKNLTGSQEDLYKFTEAVAASLRVDGKSATEASGALTQLGQVLRGTKIEWEDFSSLVDGAPALLEAAASGSARFGGDVSKLSKAVKDGKVTSKEFFDAVLAGSKVLQDRVSGSLQTVEGALTKLDNAFTRFVGSLDASAGISDKAARALGWLAENLDLLGRIAKVQYAPLVNIVRAIDRITQWVTKSGDAAARQSQTFAFLGRYIEVVGDQVASGKMQIPAATVESVKTWTKEVQDGTRSVRSAIEALDALPDDAFGSTQFRKAVRDRLQEIQQARDELAAESGAGATTPGETASRRPIWKPPPPEPEKEKGKGGKSRSTSPRPEPVPREAVPDNSAMEAFDRSIEAVERRTRALRDELEVSKLTGDAARVRAHELELENAAIDAGVEINDELRDRITLTAMTAAAQEKLNEAYKRTKEDAEAAAEAQQQAIDYLGNEAMNVISGLASRTMTLDDALKNLASSLANAALQASLLGSGPLASLFGMEGKDGKLGGLLGSIIGAIGGSIGGGGSGLGYGTANAGTAYVPDGKGGLIPHIARGGQVHGPGTGTSDSILARLSDGEFVVNAAATKRNRALLEAINNGGLPGYADGGMVGVPRLPSMTIPRIPDMRAGAGGPQIIRMQPQVNVSVIGPNGDAQIKQMVAQGVSTGLRAYDDRLPGRMTQIQRNGR